MNKPAESNAGSPQPSLTTWIMLAVLIWGCLLALGSYLYDGGSHAMARAAVIFAVTVAFLTLWLGALAMRKRRLEREDDDA
jgi:hypothetical protein